MDRITVTFIKASLLYLLAGSTLGAMVLFWPAATGIYRSIHAHLNVFGWLTMMVFGVSYHILPRFSGRPLYSQVLARVHLWLSNIGLIGLIIFWALAGYGVSFMSGARAVFGALLAVSIYLFVYNMWRTVKGVEVR